MLSNSSKYALKALVYLALHTHENNKMTVKEVSAHVNVPKAYIAKLLQGLSKRNLISSTRGPKGGFYLNETNKAQPIINIVYAVEGRKHFNSCFLGQEDCDEERPCPLHNKIGPSRNMFLKTLQNTSVKDLAQDLKTKRTFIS